MPFIHSIKKQIFEFTSASEKRSRDIQNRLSSLNRRRLTGIIRDVLDEFSEEGKITRIDSLTIDLGQLDPAFFERQITGKVEKQLRQKLREVISVSSEKPSGSGKGRPEKPQFINSGDHAYQVLSGFLKQGRMPWWYPKAGKSVDALFLETAKKYPETIIRLIEEAKKSKKARKRLVFQLKIRSLRQLIRILVPGQSGFIRKYLQNFLRINKSKPWTTMSQRQLEEKVKAVTMDFLFEGKQSLTAGKLFKEKLIREVFAGRNLTTRQKQLLSVLGNDLGKSPVRKEYLADHTEKDLLLHYLKYGSIPYWGSVMDSSNLEEFVLRMTRENPDVFKEIFTRAKPETGMIIRLASRFSGTVFEEVLKIILQSDWKSIIALTADLVDFQTAIQKTKPGKRISEVAIRTSVLLAVLQRERQAFRSKVFMAAIIPMLAEKQAFSPPAYARLLKIHFSEYKKPQSKLFNNGELEEYYEGLPAVEPESEIHLTHDEDPPTAEPESEIPITPVEVIPAQQQVSRFDLLVFYLEKGYLPWWHTELDNADLEEILSELIIKAPQDLLGHFKKTKELTAIKTRLINRFSHETLTQLIGARFPEYKGFIVTVIMAVGDIFEDYLTPLHSGGRHDFVWNALLPLTWKKKPSVFGPGEFLGKSIQRVARAANVKEETLIKAIISFSKQKLDHGEERFSPLLDVLSELLKKIEELEQSLESLKPKDMVPRNVSSARKKEQELEHFISSQLEEIKLVLFPGRKAAETPVSTNKFPPGSLEGILVELVFRYPEKLKELLPYFIADRESRVQLVENLQRPLVEKITQFLQPAQKEIVPVFIDEAINWIMAADDLNLSNQDAEVLVRSEMLGYLMYKVKPAFDKATFLRVLIVRLARAKAIPAAKVLKSLSGNRTKDQPKLSLEIEELLSEISKQNIFSVSTGSVVDKASSYQDDVQKEKSLVEKVPHSVKEKIYEEDQTETGIETDKTKHLKGAKPSLIAETQKAPPEEIKKEEEEKEKVKQDEFETARSKLQDLFEEKTETGKDEEQKPDLTKKEKGQIEEQKIPGIEKEGKKSKEQLKSEKEAEDKRKEEQKLAGTKEDDEQSEGLKLFEKKSKTEKTEEPKILQANKEGKKSGEQKLRGKKTGFEKTEEQKNLKKEKEPESSEKQKALKGAPEIEKTGFQETEKIKPSLPEIDPEKTENKNQPPTSDEHPPAKEQPLTEEEIRKRIIREKIQLATRSRKSRKKRIDIPEGVEPESIYINNAGLVLLHPFLPMFFKTLGVDMKEPENRHRAVHLLQYIVYKQTETPEEELVLNKILCGIPLEDPVPLGIEISEAEINLSTQIILSAVKNWDVMKNTTVDNFRVTFLQREGRLIEEAERWVLRVNPSTYDLLLKTLPWGLGIIKLSWMEKMIHIEWM